MLKKAQEWVLVVSDAPCSANSACGIAKKAGFECETVRSDVLAYEALGRGAPYRALIVEVDASSGAAGYAVARFAREMRPQLSVIYVSGDRSGNFYRVLAVPESQFLVKPVDEAELTAALNGVSNDPSVVYLDD